MNQVQEHSSISSLYDSLVAPDQLRKKLQIMGLQEGQKSWLASALAHHYQFSETGDAACLILVVADPKRLHEWQELLRVNCNLEDDIPSLQALSLWGLQRHANQSDLRNQRMRVLCGLKSTRQRLRLCLVSFAGLVQETCDPARLGEALLHLEKEQEYDVDAILERLQEQGYRQVAQVEEAGQYAVRGGLLDVFSPAAEGPMRLEFMADTLISIRRFAAETQLSLDHCEGFWLAPVWEEVLPRERRSADAQKLYEALLDQELHTSDRQGLVDAFAAGHAIGEIPLFLPLFRERRGACLLDFMEAQDRLVFVDPLDVCQERFLQFMQKIQADYADDRLARRPSMDPKEHFLPVEAFQAKLQKAPSTVEWGHAIASEGAEVWRLSSLLPHDLVPPAATEKASVNFWMERLEDFSNTARRCLILVRQEEHILRMKSVLQHHHIAFSILTEKGVEGVRAAWKHPIAIAIGNIPQMFWEEREGLLILPEHQIFSETYQVAKRKPKSAANPFKSFNDIEPGSLVVHVDHGIGRYIGMRTMEVAGVKTDFLILEYADQDRLYLPVHRLNLLQRYASKIDEELQPAVDKLQSSGWQKRKAKARKAIRDMADQLLRIYAQRKLERRDPFSPPSDTYYQFEADFPYVETSDQQKAIDEVNADLSSEQPMDRLVCGDVGFGKTEVALRAAMRVALDGGQVMVLAPTTLLSYQHFETFKSRCKNYGIEVGVANRFVPASQMRQTLAAFNEGRLDILIGTHRLLSKDVKPSRLGLLVVDEEQRFGVGHKEAIKQIKASCDVLTLTATPIPRSLHMSLLGIRDISVIATPPTERLAIRTYVAQFEEELIQKAIEQEISRGGQVFFVHNRVQDIGEVKNFLEKLLPGVSIAIAHGQMQENNVESVIIDFIQQKYKVLLCTTIIESGIDMPNVNTIIINNADKFGLAQLYQMRGRVGRSSRQSYAWFLTKGALADRDDARRRLEILAAHQELGVGFQIASYDMELRGTGNLLGGEQSGHIADVGFDMYMELLEKEMDSLRGREIEPEIDPEIKLPVSASLPASYVAEEKQRLWLYKTLFSARDVAEVETLVQQSRDRFGVPPPEALGLFQVAALKVILRKLRVQQLQQLREGLYELRFAQLKENHIGRLTDAVQKQAAMLSLTADFRLMIHLRQVPQGVSLQRLIEVLLPLTLDA
ncbi:transcription-repair coupling factor [Oligoflexus tunisiensis]|uniref:transcription-repair coupling factor n=1 Tax=Oligoflexus tunisiensis TaxID=708132 RepID=UPI00114C905E|nr:transcription-repair coupling factor [Oligoflexus tunisiensis]